MILTQKGWRPLLVIQMTSVRGREESNQHIACCRILYENSSSSLNPPLSQCKMPVSGSSGHACLKAALQVASISSLVSFHLGQGWSAALSLLLAQMLADNCSSGRVWLLPNISLPFLLMSFLSLIITCYLGPSRVSSRETRSSLSPCSLCRLVV